jgi:hypothetical protein
MAISLFFNSIAPRPLYLGGGRERQQCIRKPSGSEFWDASKQALGVWARDALYVVGSIEHIAAPEVLLSVTAGREGHCVQSLYVVFFVAMNKLVLLMVWMERSAAHPAGSECPPGETELGEAGRARAVIEVVK